MKANRKKSPTWKFFFIALLSILFLSNSTFASLVRRPGRVTLCNGNKAEMRFAFYILEESSFFSPDCGWYSTDGCHVKIWNWQRLSDGDCKTLITGIFDWISYAIQIKDSKGNWYSPTYVEDAAFRSGEKRGKGMSGVSDRSLCVKDDTYSTFFDRRIKGLGSAVNDEKCSTGYSRVPVNLFVRSEDNLDYTVTLR